MFRQHRGLRLLALVEEVLPRHRRGHRGDWHISLSKPSEKEQHLLMTLVGEQGEQVGPRSQPEGSCRADSGPCTRARGLRGGHQCHSRCRRWGRAHVPRGPHVIRAGRWAGGTWGPAETVLTLCLCPPGVVPTQDVLSMLGDIRRSLEEVSRGYAALKRPMLWVAVSGLVGQTGEGTLFTVEYVQRGCG